MKRACRFLLTAFIANASMLAFADDTNKPAPKKTDADDKAAPPVQVDRSPVIAPGTRVKENIAFVENAGDQQKLDVYAPADAKNATVVIFVHGGEWTKGDKRDVSHKPKFFVENGVIFVSTNYRLSGTARHPAQVEDVASAVRWVRDHIAEFGGDPKKIVLMGHSAGCHLVTLATLDPRWLGKVGMKASDLKGVVSWSGGAFDLPAKVAEAGMYADYIHKTFGDNKDVWREASPIAHIRDNKTFAKYLFASAGDGKPASRQISERMAEMIKSAGGRAETTVVEGKAHSAASDDVGKPGDHCGDVLLRFVLDPQ